MVFCVEQEEVAERPEAATGDAFYELDRDHVTIQTLNLDSQFICTAADRYARACVTTCRPLRTRHVPQNGPRLKGVLALVIDRLSHRPLPPIKVKQVPLSCWWAGGGLLPSCLWAGLCCSWPNKTTQKYLD